MNKPTAKKQANQTTLARVIAPAGNNDSWKSTFILLAICLVALLGVCLYLMAEKPNSLDNVTITPQPGFAVPTTPDAHGRPPGDAHYGHDHP